MIKNVAIAAALMAATVVGMGHTTAQTTVTTPTAIPTLGPATATDPGCPLGYTCLEYQGAVLQLDPDEGPYQLVIVAEVSTTTVTFTEEATERSIVAAGFAQGDDGVFEFDREYRRPRTGVFSTAELGDVLGTGE